MKYQAMVSELELSLARAHRELEIAAVKKSPNLNLRAKQLDELYNLRDDLRARNPKLTRLAKIKLWVENKVRNNER